MVHYAGYCPRFHPSDFEVRSRDGIAEDWPLRYQDLKAHYERLELELPVAGDYWPWGDPHRYPHTPHPILPFDEAIASATEQMFQSFKMDGDNGTSPLPFVIDPLIDGATGAQSKGTFYIQDKVLALATTKYTRFQVQPFTATALNSKPLVLIGTLVIKPTGLFGERVVERM